MINLINDSYGLWRWEGHCWIFMIRWEGWIIISYSLQHGIAIMLQIRTLPDIFHSLLNERILCVPPQFNFICCSVQAKRNEMLVNINVGSFQRTGFHHAFCNLWLFTLIPINQWSIYDRKRNIRISPCELLF